MITVVEEQQAYLDPHLTLQDVADRCGYNRTYISGLVKGELGGFFNYPSTPPALVPPPPITK